MHHAELGVHHDLLLQLARAGERDELFEVELAVAVGVGALHDVADDLLLRLLPEQLGERLAELGDVDRSRAVRVKLLEDVLQVLRVARREPAVEARRHAIGLALRAARLPLLLRLDALRDLALPRALLLDDRRLERRGLAPLEPRLVLAPRLDDLLREQARRHSARSARRAASRESSASTTWVGADGACRVPRFTPFSCRGERAALYDSGGGGRGSERSHIHISRAMDDHCAVSFDDDYSIRVLDVDKFKHTEELSEDCNVFVTKIQDFNSTVHTLVEVLDAHSEKIETEKLKAIGQRNRVTAEAETRETMKKSMQALINEKQAELERYSKQYQSLLRVEAEQRAHIDKLSNSEG